MIVILTHGKKGVIFGTDGEVDIEDLVQPLKFCKGLAGKPKLIFIQASELVWLFNCSKYL
jgi:hypothetical protein